MWLAMMKWAVDLLVVMTRSSFHGIIYKHTRRSHLLPRCTTLVQPILNPRQSMERREF